MQSRQPYIGMESYIRQLLTKVYQNLIHIRKCIYMIIVLSNFREGKVVEPKLFIQISNTKLLARAAARVEGLVIHN